MSDSGGDASCENNQCVICFEPLLLDLSVLPCGHVFHFETCIREHLRHKPTCPVCRAPAKKASKLFYDVSGVSQEYLKLTENTELRELKQALLGEQDALDATKASLWEARKDHAILEGELEKLKCTNASLHVQQALNMTRELELKRLVKAISEERDELHQSFEGTSKAQMDTAAKMDNLNGENRVLKAEVQKHARREVELKMQLEDKKQENRTLATQLSECRTRLRHAEMCKQSAARKAFTVKQEVTTQPLPIPELPALVAPTRVQALAFRPPPSTGFKLPSSQLVPQKPRRAAKQLKIDRFFS